MVQLDVMADDFARVTVAVMILRIRFHQRSLGGPGSPWQYFFVLGDCHAMRRYVIPGMGNDFLVEKDPNEETPMVEPGEVGCVNTHFYLIHIATVRVVESEAVSGIGGDQ